MNQQDRELIDRTIDDLTPSPIDQLSKEVRERIEQALNGYIHSPLDNNLMERMQATVNGILHAHELVDELDVIVEQSEEDPTTVKLLFQHKVPPPRVRF